MRTRPSWLSSLLAAALLVAVGTAWIVFAPLQFGGQAAYVLISGNSMEPLYHRGDLVITRAARAYGIGDIVTYRHPQIGVVIHRIVARDRQRFVTKGDNNEWLDGYEPEPADILGTAWLHLPGLGRALEQVRRPVNLALLAGLAGVVIMSTAFEDLPPGRRLRRRSNWSRRTMKRFLRFHDDLLFILAALGLGALVLAWVSFSRPLTQTSTLEVGYDQKGEFAYTGPAP